MIFNPQPSVDSPFVVDGYSYGFKKSQCRFYVETTKRGDRTVKQTLNPKSLQWNKPKKSTYSEVILLGKLGNPEKIETVVLLNAINKTRRHVNITVRETEFRHKVTGEIKTTLDVFELNDYEEVGKEERDKEQDKIKKDLRKVYAGYRALEENKTMKRDN